MSDVDTILNGLRTMAVDPRLDAMDDAVLHGLAEHRAKGVARKGLILTSVLALGIGLAASQVSPQDAHAAQVAFNAVPASAPSSLLMGVR